MKKFLPFFLMAVIVSASTALWAQGQAPVKSQPTPQGQQTSQAAAPASNTMAISPQELFAYIMDAAEKGDLEAMLTVGTFYEQGLGVPRHFGKALEWYKKAAEAGSVPAAYNVGLCYEIGMGITPNDAEALKWYATAADKNLPQALYKLAGLYLAGQGVKADQAKAVDYLNKAMAAGHPVAANELGIIYMNGLWGQKKDGAKALASFIKAAELGNVEAMKNVAVVYKDGLAGQKIDNAKALQWYLVSRASGYPAADLGDIIDTLGKGMKPEQIKTVETAANTWLSARAWNQPPPDAPQQAAPQAQGNAAPAPAKK